MALPSTFAILVLLSAGIGASGAVGAQIVAHFLTKRREERQRERLIHREGELLAELGVVRAVLTDIRDAIRQVGPTARPK